MPAKDDLGFFPFGATYAPVVKALEVGREHWDGDLASFRGEGFTAVRGWISWDRMEPREGVRDFSAAERLLELAEKHGLRVMINIGGVFTNLLGLYPPRWLIGRCGPPRDARGTAQNGTGPRRSVCMNDPLYREAARDFLEDLVPRLARSPALFSWCVWNEPAWPGCHCPHCQELFRDWLRTRYRSIEGLNDRWGTEFPVLYGGFDEVEAPAGVGFEEGGYAAWLDWNEFAEDTLAGSLAWIRDIVKPLDPLDRPTTTNLTPANVLGAHPMSHANPSKIGQVVDVLGFSHYTYTQDDPRDFALRLDWIRSASRTGSLWIIETESGPVYWVHHNLPGHTRTAERILRYWQAVGRNTTALLCWLYRTRMTDAQSGEFGLRAWDGSPTERSRETGKLAASLSRHAALFRNRSVPREIAVWASHRSLRLGTAEGYEDVPDARKRYWSRSARGAHRMAHALGFRTDFIDEHTPRERILDGYRAILVPFCPDMDGETAALFAEYVSHGGLLVSEFPLGFKDRYGVLAMRCPGAGLDRLFGCRAADALPAAAEDGDIALCLPDGSAASLRPGSFLMDLSADPDTEVLGRCAGKPAVTSRAHGRGRAVFFATMFFAAYGEGGGDAGARMAVLRSLCAAHGVAPRFSVSAGPGSAAGLLEACPLIRGDREEDVLCVVSNHGQEATPFSLLVRGRVGEAADAFTGGPLEAVPAAGGTEIRGSLDGKGTAVLSLRWTP